MARKFTDYLDDVAKSKKTKDMNEAISWLDSIVNDLQASVDGNAQVYKKFNYPSNIGNQYLIILKDQNDREQVLFRAYIGEHLPMKVDLFGEKLTSISTQEDLEEAVGKFLLEPTISSRLQELMPG